MRWAIAAPLLATIGAEYALGNHHHGLRHGHVQLGARGIDWTEHIPKDIIVRTRTITTTIYKNCLSTSVLDSTTTVLAQLIHVPTNGAAVAAATVVEPSTVEWMNAMLTSLLPNQAMPTLTNVDKPGPTPDEPTTTVEMTTTVTKIQTVKPSGITLEVRPSSANTSSAEPASMAASQSPPVPKAPGKVNHQTTSDLLHTIPELPQGLVNTSEDAVSQLPLPNLPPLPVDQILHPNGAPVPSELDWTTIPKDGVFTTERFGGRTKPSGTQIKYQGNTGIPWGSNIISVSPTEAHRYKYVVRFAGSNAEPWTITIWNKVGPEGKMDGWYGHSALTFILAPGETRFVAFDEDSEGAWGAAPGTKGLPVDDWGGFTSTWGEFSFGDAENDGWSGWDVSAIQAQIARQEVQGMRICMADGKGCSLITPGANKVVDAYTESDRHHDGIGGAASPGPVRLVVDIDYQG